MQKRLRKAWEIAGTIWAFSLSRMWPLIMETKVRLGHDNVIIATATLSFWSYGLMRMIVRSVEGGNATHSVNCAI